MRRMYPTGRSLLPAILATAFAWWLSACHPSQERMDGSLLVQRAPLATPGWRATGTLAKGRVGHTATPLANGKVLISGGYDGANSVSTSELYDPSTGTFSSTGALVPSRRYHSATLLPNGKVLIASG